MAKNAKPAPIIDREQLIRRMMGSDDMAKRMIHRFVESAAAECDLIESTVRLGDKASLESLAHRHKGTAQTMASSPVADVAGRLELHAQSDEISELLEIVEELRSLHREVAAFAATEFSATPTEKVGT